MIIAKTFKGRNLGPEVENNMHYHGKPLGDKAEEAVALLKSMIEGQAVDVKHQEPLVTEQIPCEPLKAAFTEYD